MKKYLTCAYALKTWVLFTYYIFIEELQIIIYLKKMFLKVRTNIFK